jgi:hypothetical protein
MADGSSVHAHAEREQTKFFYPQISQGFFYPQITPIIADFWRPVLPLRGNSRRRFFAD